MSDTAAFFEDLIVLELANVLAGPSVGLFLAELGATVVKVESPAGGDVTRRWTLPGETLLPGGISAYFSSVNWGKQSIAVNLKTPEGRAVVQDLVRRADILVHSYKPGDAARFGLDEPAVRALNERIIYACVTAYGPDDPRTGYDAVLQAETGFTGLNGTPESGPVKMPVALIDLLLAHQLKEGILVALIERLLTGRGSAVGASLFQAGVASLANQAANYLVGGVVPQRSGSEHPNIAPYGTAYDDREGRPVVLAVGTDRQFESLCGVLGMKEAARDPRFRTNAERVAHRAALNALLAARIARMTREDLLEALHADGVPAGAVQSLDEVFARPAARELLMTGNPTEGTPLRGLRTLAFETGAVPTRRPLVPPPVFNGDARAVLSGRLGYSEERITALHRAGAIPADAGETA